MRHNYFMQQAINIARHGLGNVGDNPAVGCLIVADGQIIGRGHTQIDGRHAEVMALQMANKVAPKKISGATVYVTLEPCAHFGRTPPCANILVAAKIAQVFVGVKDPDPRVAGRGIQVLKNHGIKVETGILKQQAKQGLSGFLSRIQTHKPHVMLKLAMSSDGYIARADGSSKWITCPQSRYYAHKLRAQSDAILIGVETALADDPMLDCRLKGLERRSPARIILDSNLRINLSSKLVNSAKQINTIIFTDLSHETESKHQQKITKLKQKNIQIQYISKNRQHLELTQLLSRLAKLGINRLMVEGGAKVASSFIKQNLVDELNLFFAPELIGQGGKPAIEMGIKPMLESGKFEQQTHKQINLDRFEIWHKT